MIELKPDLTGKVAVVTGGGGVLGTSFAEALASAGAAVAILDLNEEAACKVADSLNGKGYRAIGVKANVLQKESLREAEKSVREKLGECDILINGAGGNHPKGTTDNEFLTPKIWRNPISRLSTNWMMRASALYST